MARQPKDTYEPILLTTSPSDNAKAVPVDANIVLTFDEAVKAGNGYFYIYDDKNNLIERISAKSKSVTYNSLTKSVTINPTQNLTDGTNYHVTVDSRAIKDIFGNTYAGFTDSTTLNFTTEGPDPSIVIFDLTTGKSSSHSGRAFQADQSYDIWIVAPDMNSWGHVTYTPDPWGSAYNLGADDFLHIVFPPPYPPAGFRTIGGSAKSAVRETPQTPGTMIYGDLNFASLGGHRHAAWGYDEKIARSEWLAGHAATFYTGSRTDKSGPIGDVNVYEFHLLNFNPYNGYIRSTKVHGSNYTYMTRHQSVPDPFRMSHRRSSSYFFWLFQGTNAAGKTYTPNAYIITDMPPGILTTQGLV